MGRSATLAAAIVTLIEAWDGLPADVPVTRVRSVIQLIKDLPESAPATIAVINPSIEDISNRGDVADEVMIAIVVVANCDSNSAADSDTWDELTEALRDYLRTSTAAKSFTVGSVGAQRKQVNTTMTCDADLLNENDVFVSVTETTWHISVGNRS